MDKLIYNEKNGEFLLEWQCGQAMPPVVFDRDDFYMLVEFCRRLGIPLERDE